MIEEEVNKYLIAKNEKERLEHVASGYLSASRLDKTTLENVLYLIGVPTLEFTPYSLKVFERGKQVEEWLEKVLTEAGMVERSQTMLEYTTPEGHKIVGIEDLTLKGEDFPTEVKSIKNSSFKYLDIEGAKLGNILQAVMYALAEGKDKARVLYVAADDLRTKQFIVNVADYKDQVHEVARNVYEAIKSGVLPEFKPITDFQKMEKYLEYTSYPDWFGEYSEGSVDGKIVRKGVVYPVKRKEMVLTRPYTQAELMAKLRKEYPDAFKKLKGEK